MTFCLSLTLFISGGKFLCQTLISTFLEFRRKTVASYNSSAMRLDNSCFENNTNVCFLSCLNKLLGSHFVKVFRSPWDVHVPLIKSLHFILAQSGNSLIAAACPLKSIQKEHNRNTVTPLEERSDKSWLTLSIIEHVDRLLMSQMGLLMVYW